MTYGFDLTQQLRLFLYSLGFGFLLGFVYRFIMILRKEISEKKTAVIAGDLIFCITATVADFCFLLINADGQIRLIALFANAAGFALYILTADFTFKKLITYPVRGFIKLIKLIFKPFSVVVLTLKSLGKKVSERIKNKKTENKQKQRKNKPDKKNKNAVKSSKRQVQNKIGIKRRKRSEKV